MSVLRVAYVALLRDTALFPGHRGLKQSHVWTLLVVDNASEVQVVKGDLQMAIRVANSSAF